MQASTGLKDICRQAQAYARLMQAGLGLCRPAKAYADRPRLLQASKIYVGFKYMQAGRAA